MTSFLYSSEVRSHCNRSRREIVDLHKILKFSFLLWRSLLQFLINTFMFISISPDCQNFFCRGWLLAFRIRQNNNGVLLNTEWNWHNYEFWNLTYCDALVRYNHRNIIHKYDLIAKYNQVFCVPYNRIYKCICTAFFTRQHSSLLRPYGHLAPTFLSLLISWRILCNFAILFASTDRRTLLWLLQSFGTWCSVVW
jgi:hypothetical protein